jgi:hypothetical protein
VPTKLHVTFVINGEPTPVEGKPGEQLVKLLEKALKESENTGQPVDAWQVTDEPGNVLDVSKTLGELGIKDGAILLASLKAGQSLPQSGEGQHKQPTAPTTATLPKDIDAADQVTNTLKPGQIVFNPPPKMKVGIRQIVSEFAGDLKSDLGLGGPIREEKIPTGRFMAVSLSGVGFDFKESPGLKNGGGQIVPKGSFSEWIFYVTPVESGKLKLLLTASIRYKILGKEEFQNQPVIERDIDVEVNRIYVIEEALLAEWKWVAGGIGSVLVASFGVPFRSWLDQRKNARSGVLRPNCESVG